MKDLFIKSLIILTATLFLGVFSKPVHAQKYDSYIWSSSTPAVINAENSSVRDELVQEIRKIINAGHLAPALFDTGLRTGNFGLLFWATPAETLASLSMAYSYLPSDLQIQVKTYLDAEIAAYPPHQYGIFPPPWGGMKLSDQPGARREWFPINPNRSINIWPQVVPSIEVLYPIWLYSDTTGDWTYAQNNWTRLSTIYNNFKSSETPDSYLKIAGVIGYARIARQLNHPAEASDAAGLATTGLTNGVNFNQFLQTAKTKYNATLYTTPVFLYGQGGILAGYFPQEIGQFIKDNALTSAQSYVIEISEDVPLWYLTATGWGLSPRMVLGAIGPLYGTNYVAEDSYITPEVGWTNFMLHAYILKDNVDTLKDYLDFPSRVGDLFHIQKLVATIEAAPTTPSSLTGDVNQDAQVNVLDIQACVNDILGIQDFGSRADVNSDGSVNVLDVQNIVNIILGV